MYMKTTSSEHVVYINCSECQSKNKKQFSELVVFMYRTRNSMKNLLSYCGLVDERISASDKDLPVLQLECATGKSSIKWALVSRFN